jgi:DNA-binding SARP family transcriptional activator/streptogramin lyase
VGPDAPTSRLEFRLLGPLEVRRDGRPVPLGGGKQRTLLALLLLRANEVVLRDTLIEELSGGAAGESAANALQAGIWRLRRLLGAEVISTRPAGYALVVEPDQIDLSRFERLAEAGRAELAAGQAERAAARLREALALWRGSPLQDVGAEAVEAEGRRLEELRLAATMDRIDADLALGHGAELVAELKALTADQPYQERLRGQLMLALYRAGRQTEALEVYRATRRLLAEELGIEPAAALQRLERAILVHDPALAPPRPAPPKEAREGRRRVPRLAVAAAVLLAVAALAGFLLTRGGGTDARLGPDRLGVIDPRSGRLVDSVGVATDVTSIDAGDGAVWAASERAGVVVRVAAKTRAVKTIGLPVAPAALAVGRDTIWVVGEGKLVGIDVKRNQPLEPVVIWPPIRRAVAVGLGGVWVNDDARLEVDRFDPRADRLQTIFPIYPGGIGSGRAAIAVGVGAVWASNLTALLSSRPGFLVRIDPRSRTVTGSLRLSAAPSALAAGFGSVWAAFDGTDVVARIDPGKVTISRTISVGRNPVALAVGEGAVWVASDGDRTISRVDPTTERVTKTIHLPRSPVALATGAGFVWVATT